MNRRDALKALASVAGATGMTVTPVTTQDVQRVELVLLKVKEMISQETANRLKESWRAAVEGTSLASARAFVFDEAIEVEFVRTR